MSGPTKEEVEAALAAAQKRKDASKVAMSEAMPFFPGAPPPSAPAAAAPPPGAPPSVKTTDVSDLPNVVQQASKPADAMGTGLKDAAFTAAANLLVPGGGALVAHGVRTAQAASKSPALAPSPSPPPAPTSTSGEPAGPPAPEGAPTKYPVWNQGGGGKIIPGGMQPHSMTVSREEGVPVSNDTKLYFRDAGQDQLNAAQMQRENDARFGEGAYEAERVKQEAIDRATADHAAVQADREQMVRQRLAEIDAFNRDANAKVQSPTEIWEDKSALAKVFGAIASGLHGFANRGNGAINPIDAAIQQEANTQIKNRELAGNRARAHERLYGLHLDALKDQDLAIDATKKGLFENALTMLDKERIRKGIADTDPNYLNVRADILSRLGDLTNKMQVQEWGKKQSQYQEVYRPPQMVGAGMGAGKNPMEGKELIYLPPSLSNGVDGAAIAVPKDSHKDLATKIGAAVAIAQFNEEGMKNLDIMDKSAAIMRSPDATAQQRLDAMARFRGAMAENQEKAMQKSSYLSKTLGEGVQRDPEFERAMKYEAHMTATDWATTNTASLRERLQAQNNMLAKAAAKEASAHGGEVVQMGYQQTPNGLVPAPRYTGQPYTPPAVMPTMKRVMPGDKTQ